MIICLKKESNGERQRHPSCIHKLNFLHSSWTHGVCLFVYVCACVCVVRVSCSSWKQRCSLCWKVDSVAGLWRCCQPVCVEDGCGRQRAGISPCHLSDHRVPRPAVNDMSASAWLKKNLFFFNISRLRFNRLILTPEFILVKEELTACVMLRFIRDLQMIQFINFSVCLALS